MELANPLELFQRHAQLPKNFEEQRRADVPSAVKWDGDRSAVWVDPAFVTAGLAARKPSAAAARWNWRAVALGMHDFGRVLWQRLSSLLIFLGDYREHALEFGERCLTRGHQCVAAAESRDLGHPRAVCLPVQDDFIVVKAHESDYTALAEEVCEGRELAQNTGRIEGIRR